LEFQNKIGKKSPKFKLKIWYSQNRRIGMVHRHILFRDERVNFDVGKKSQVCYKNVCIVLKELTKKLNDLFISEVEICMILKIFRKIENFLKQMFHFLIKIQKLYFKGMQRFLYRW